MNNELGKILLSSFFLSYFTLFTELNMNVTSVPLIIIHQKVTKAGGGGFMTGSFFPHSFREIVFLIRKQMRKI